jgi:hypothetical protein
MLYSEIIAVCSQIHTKHTNTLCGQNVELLCAKLVARIMLTEVRKISQYMHAISNCTVQSMMLCCSSTHADKTCHKPCILLLTCHLFVRCLNLEKSAVFEEGYRSGDGFFCGACILH